MSRRGVVSMGREDLDPAPSPNVPLNAGALTKPAGPVRSPAGQAEPSWGRVLVNTVKLAVLRRLRAAGLRLRRASGSRPWHTGRRWRFATLVLVLAGAAVIVLWLTGGLTGTPSRAARAPAVGAGPPSLAAGAQGQAAAWIAGQVSGDAIIACYPGMCAALQERGVAAGRLMPLRSAAASPLGASVLAISPPAGGQLAGRYAPALIASFGSGSVPGSRSARSSPAGRPPTAPRCGPTWPRAGRRDLSCSGTRASGSPGRAPHSCGRVRWIHACWPRWRRWRRSTRSG